MCSAKSCTASAIMGMCREYLGARILTGDTSSAQCLGPVNISRASNQMIYSIDTGRVSKVPAGIRVRPPLARLTMASRLESSTRQDISSRGSFKVHGTEVSFDHAKLLLLSREGKKGKTRQSKT